MEDLALGRIAALVPEFAVKDLPLGRTHDDDDDDEHFIIWLAALAQMVPCLPLVQQVRGSIPGGLVNFDLKISNHGARRGGDVHFLIARLHRPGLNSKPSRSMYVEKAYSTVDSDSSVGWGR